VVECITWQNPSLKKYTLVPGKLYVWCYGSNVLEYRWYHNDIGSDGVEALLKGRGQDGSFLVRASYSSPGDYSLCVR